jgi:hypothetical protein
MVDKCFIFSIHPIYFLDLVMYNIYIYMNMNWVVHMFTLLLYILRGVLWTLFIIIIIPFVCCLAVLLKGAPAPEQFAWFQGDN